MTHFVVYVIVPKEIAKGDSEGYNENAIQDYIDGVMEPYSENKEIKPYIYKSALAVRREMRKVNKEHPELAEKYEGKSIDEAYYDWAGYKLDSHGNALSTWNKKSFYDWYRIGGRWSGFTTGVEKKSDNGFNFSDECEQLNNNIIQVKELLEKAKMNPDYIVHVIIADGRVISAGRHGWWGTFSEKKTKSKKDPETRWRTRFTNLLKKHKNDYVVNLDCHV